jgi:hypothetical protein
MRFGVFSVELYSDRTEKKPMKHINLLTTFVLLLSLCAPLVGQKRPVNTTSSVDLLITGGTLITMDGSRRVIENGAIAVKNGEILRIGTAAELRGTRATQTINAAGKVIIPGLINTHTHVPMSLFRGIADDLDLNEWLTKYIFPAEAKNVDEAFVRAGTRLGLAEMIRGGTPPTAICIISKTLSPTRQNVPACAAYSARQSSTFRSPTIRRGTRRWRTQSGIYESGKPIRSSFPLSRRMRHIRFQKNILDRSRPSPKG